MFAETGKARPGRERKASPVEATAKGDRILDASVESGPAPVKAVRAEPQASHVAKDRSKEEKPAASAETRAKADTPERRDRKPAGRIVQAEEAQIGEEHKTAEEQPTNGRKPKGRKTPPELGRAMKIKRWEDREDAFEGFDSPPGRF